jgi:hypothetical protein
MPSAGGLALVKGRLRQETVQRLALDVGMRSDDVSSLGVVGDFAAAPSNV